jgi:hypothetical protein
VKKLLFAVGAVAAAALTMALVASAAGFTLHGGAQAEPGDVKLVSDLSNASTTDDASWIDFSIPSGLKFSDLTALSTQFNVTNDDCGGGSPRFQINVSVGGATKNVFVYLGPTPNFTGCAQNTWLSSGNLVGTSEKRVDSTQVGGPFYGTWADAMAKVGSNNVTGIQLTVDGGWFFTDKEQTVLVRDLTINHKSFITAPMPGEKQNPAKLCAAQRALMGSQAFNAFWGKNVNDRNAFGKCVSAMARTISHGNATSVQASILNAAKTCKAHGLHRGHLAACVAEHSKKGRKR